MSYIKKIVLITFTIIIFQNNVYAENPYYLDFKYILNQSEAGKKAQKALKSKLENGIKNIQEKGKKLQEEEKKLSHKKSYFS